MISCKSITLTNHSSARYLSYLGLFSFKIFMSTKAPPSQTGDTAPSTTSTTSTTSILGNPESDPQPLQNNQVMKEETESPDSGDGDDLSGDTNPGGFTLLMTVAALAMSMFLVRSCH